MIKTNRIVFIDALRGFAALYVLIFHVVEVPQPNLPHPHFLYPLIHNGWSGVILFFVLSAFTLCYTLDGKQYDNEEVKKFYLRRLFRIGPLYYSWLLFMILTQPRLYTSLSLLLFVCFGFNFFPGKQMGFVPASWTLGIEMIFYLFFPFLFRYFNSLQRAFYFLAACLALSLIHRLLLTGVTNYNTYFTIFTHLPVFATGMITYFIFKELSSFPVSQTIGTVLFWLSLTAMILIPYGATLDVIYRAYLMAGTYACLIIGVCISPQPVLERREFAFLGLISYSLYLDHPQILFLLTPVYRKIYDFVPLPLVVCEGLTFVLVVLFSYFTYRIIEKPGIDLARRLTKRKFYPVFH